MAEQSKPSPPNSCSGCDATWTGTVPAHCAAEGCHRTFSSIKLFDHHREATRDSSRCLDPANIRHNGARIMFFRDGMWRSPPMSEEAAARLRASR